MIGEIFNAVLLRPVLNTLLVLYALLGQNYALAIVVLTVLLRLITQPLMSSQLKMSKKMSEMQPQLQELQKKYGNDKERMAQEQMKLYREHGINPLGGCLPMLLQFPIWIALYQSIIQTLGRSPLQLLGLSRHIYNFGFFSGLSLLIPLASRFLWLDLARPDPLYILPILTAATMWMQQKMMSAPTSSGAEASSQSAQLNQSMQLTMPLMFGVITVNLASGLALYFVISNVVGIVMQYFTTGLGGLATLLPQGTAAALGAPTASEQKGARSGSRKKKR
ncbi:MAG: YidC/Oxa1 family membrane protein insertase [Anaerolineae bacterium]